MRRPSTTGSETGARSRRYSGKRCRCERPGSESENRRWSLTRNGVDVTLRKCPAVSYDGKWILIANRIVATEHDTVDADVSNQILEHARCVDARVVVETF